MACNSNAVPSMLVPSATTFTLAPLAGCISSIWAELTPLLPILFDVPTCQASRVASNWPAFWNLDLCTFPMHQHSTALLALHLHAAQPALGLTSACLGDESFPQLSYLSASTQRMCDKPRCSAIGTVVSEAGNCPCCRRAGPQDRTCDMHDGSWRVVSRGYALLVGLPYNPACGCLRAEGLGIVLVYLFALWVSRSFSLFFRYSLEVSLVH
jgi:hypothetical protein